MYFVIQDWMITALHLKGCELLVYAVVFGYSQKGAGCYFGSAAALAESLGVSRQTIVSTFKSLTERGLLIKTDDYHAGVHTCAYSANLDLLKNFTGCQEILQDSQKILHNNKIDSKKDNNITPSIINNTSPFTLPFEGKEFADTWELLTQQPKWRKKSRAALEMSLKKLAGYTEREAVRMMQDTIANDWQGLFPLKAGDKPTQSQYDLLCRKVGNVHASVFRQGKEMGWTRDDVAQRCGESYAKEWDEFQDIIQAL